MFYSFIRVIVRIIVYIVNGKPTYLNKEKLPTGNYILVGPHRTWFDPLYFALAASPKKFSFMAKEELFKNPILRFILVHANAFPVNRENPGPSVIKTPVKWLKKKDLSLIMFPSGTRHSQKLKGGAILIAKLSGVPVNRINFIFTILTAVTVSISARAVGALIVSSMMVVPAACSMQIVNSYKKTIIYAVIFNLFFTILGIFISYYKGLKPGATIVLISITTFIAILLIKSSKTFKK